MKKEIKTKYIFQLMEKWAPKHLAYDWDNVGLQVGSYEQKVSKVMVTLDVLESVVDEAIRNEVNVIIAHHPLLFKSLKNININTPKGRVLNKLMKHDISVYAAHTNLDVAQGGVNDILADKLDLLNRKNLVETEVEQLYKIAVYVPKTHLDAVKEGLSLANAGYIGDYSHCTFQTSGQGTFKPLEGSDPFIGMENELTYVEEVKVETIVKASDLNKAKQKIYEKHPYEEPAIDIYPLKNIGEKYGIGRIGYLPEALTLENMAKELKTLYNANNVRVTGDLNQVVKKVAILGGSGEKFISNAKHSGADVYITGDITFHAAQDAEEMGLSVIDAGHYIEHTMKEETATYLNDQLENAPIEIIVSKTNTDPFQTI